MVPWKIERLTSTHQRKDFTCGKAPLDDFLKRLARQYDARNFARSFVAVVPPSPVVLGYYTLSAGALDLNVVPADLRRKLPHHFGPIACLGRLAVAVTVQKNKLGKELLLNALHQCRICAEEIAIFAVEVNAIDEQAKAFYEHYGFAPLADNPLHLYLSMKTIANLHRRS